MCVPQRRREKSTRCGAARRDVMCGFLPVTAWDAQRNLEKSRRTRRRGRSRSFGAGPRARFALQPRRAGSHMQGPSLRHAQERAGESRAQKMKLAQSSFRSGPVAVSCDVWRRAERARRIFPCCGVGRALKSGSRAGEDRPYSRMIRRDVEEREAIRTRELKSAQSRLFEIGLRLRRFALRHSWG